MAVTQDQINSIHEALVALGTRPGDETTLGRDVSVGMTKLVELVNGGAAPADKLSYDPAVGYTPELGQALLQKIETLKESRTFQALESAYKKPLVGEAAAQAMLRAVEGVPNVMKRDPGKLFDLIEKSPQIIANLDSMYADGALVVTAAPVVVPTTPTTTDVSSTVVAAPVVPETEEEDEPPPQTIVGTAYLVELALSELVPELIKQMAAAAETSEEKLSEMPEGLRNILTALKMIPDTSILDRKIPEIGEVDGILDLRSQASLQGLLVVLSDPAIMNIPGSDAWRYTPEVGATIIRKLPELEEKLALLLEAEDLE